MKRLRTEYGVTEVKFFMPQTEQVTYHVVGQLRILTYTYQSIG